MLRRFLALCSQLPNSFTCICILNWILNLMMTSNHITQALHTTHNLPHELGRATVATLPNPSSKHWYKHTRHQACIVGDNTWWTSATCCPLSGRAMTLTLRRSMCYELRVILRSIHVASSVRRKITPKKPYVITGSIAPKAVFVVIFPLELAKVGLWVLW